MPLPAQCLSMRLKIVADERLGTVTQVCVSLFGILSRKQRRSQGSRPGLPTCQGPRMNQTATRPGFHWFGSEYFLLPIASKSCERVTGRGSIVKLPLQFASILFVHFRFLTHPAGSPGHALGFCWHTGHRRAWQWISIKEVCGCMMHAEPLEPWNIQNVFVTFFLLQHMQPFGSSE